jgi:2-polyprenyl-3-methyl-5-hydroxy-6-metoxy-1,4-benzoquinol methylase
MNQCSATAGSATKLKNYCLRTIHDTELPEQSADVVILTEVLEHIEYPHEVLNEVYRLLKPNGYFIISVPWDHPFSPF